MNLIKNLERASPLDPVHGSVEDWVTWGVIDALNHEESYANTAEPNELYSRVYALAYAMTGMKMLLLGAEYSSAQSSETIVSVLDTTDYKGYLDSAELAQLVKQTLDEDY